MSLWPDHSKFDHGHVCLELNHARLCSEHVECIAGLGIARAIEEIRLLFSWPRCREATGGIILQEQQPELFSMLVIIRIPFTGQVKVSQSSYHLPT